MANKADAAEIKGLLGIIGQWLFTFLLTFT